MERRLLMTAVLLVHLGGCAFSQIESGMNALLGQPADVLFSYIGYPNGETVVAGQRLLVYSTNYNMTLPSTQTATTTGSVHGPGGYATYSGHTTYNTVQNMNMHCELRVAVDSNNIIQNWEYFGNLGGCQRYSRVAQAAKHQRVGVPSANRGVGTPSTSSSFPAVEQTERPAARYATRNRCASRFEQASDDFSACIASIDQCGRDFGDNEGSLRPLGADPYIDCLKNIAR